MAVSLEVATCYKALMKRVHQVFNAYGYEMNHCNDHELMYWHWPKRPWPSFQIGLPKATGEFEVAVPLVSGMLYRTNFSVLDAPEKLVEFIRMHIQNNIQNEESTNVA
jgi:hypothetical protein